MFILLGWLSGSYHSRYRNRDNNFRIFQYGYINMIKIMIDSDIRLEGLEPIGKKDKIINKKIPETVVAG